MAYPYPSGDYYFAGLGFLALTLSDINTGLLNGLSTTQPCIDISYDSATGQISFFVTGSPELVQDILFTGNVIPDAFGDVAGLSGTWKGYRVVEIKTERAALPVEPPPGGLTVEGNWAAVMSMVQ